MVAAGVTLLYVAAQCGGSALFNGAHHACLPPTHASRVFCSIGRADLAKDIRHLQPARAQGLP